MTEVLESRPFGSQFSNVYLTIFALFCFKLFIKISLNILTHFYVVKGNRKEAARIAAEFYDFGQGHKCDPISDRTEDNYGWGRYSFCRLVFSGSTSTNKLPGPGRRGSRNRDSARRIS
ncbi:ankyrin repeat and SOCS box protein 5 isoform X1 [Arapaima gigas]